MHPKPPRSPARLVRGGKEEQRRGTQFQGGPPKRDRLEMEWSGFRSDMVLISGHNSKKYQAALRLKKEIAENPDKFHLPETDYDCDREIDSFGETATTCVRQSQKRLTPEEVKLLIVEYQDGKTPTELSKKYGCHRITVGKILKRNGVEVRPHIPSRAKRNAHHKRNCQTIRR